jgi:hypothetical protein
MEEALTINTISANVTWLPRPWYHEAVQAGSTPIVTVSPSPQPQSDTDKKLHTLRKYARDFRHQHTKDAQDFEWDSDDEDHGLAIGHLVVT